MKADTNNSVCVDANIILKLLVNEESSEKAHSTIENLIQEGKTIILPSFAKIEVFSVIRRKEKEKELSSQKAKLALNYFQKLNFYFINENFSLLKLAYSFSKKLSLKNIYDCVYLALAKTTNSPFLTADKIFLKKAKKVYKHCLSL